MMKKAFILGHIMIILSSLGMAQNMSINESGAEPDGSAMLDVQSSSLGILIPRMTAAQRTAILSPANGLMVYQTDGDPGLYIHDGGSLSWYKALDSSDVVNLTQQERSLNDTAGVHLMTKELVTDGNFISGDGDLEGISVDFNGRVNVTGSTAGNTNLTVNGMVRTSGDGSGLEFSSDQIAITGNNSGLGDLRLKTNNTDQLTISSGGRLGFGTTSPVGDFHIADDTLRVQSPNNFSGTSFIIEGSRHNPGSAFSTIDLRNIDVTDGNVSYSGARIESQNPGGSDDGDLRFYTTSNLVSSLSMRIDELGQVGIGTASPTSALDVNGTVRLSGELNTTSTGTYNMVPIAMASVDSPGTILNGTGNLTISNSSAGTYIVTVAGHSANINNDIVHATLTSSNGGMITVNSVSGNYNVYTRNSSGVLVDSDFNIIIYAP